MPDVIAARQVHTFEHHSAAMSIAEGVGGSYTSDMRQGPGVGGVADTP